MAIPSKGPPRIIAAYNNNNITITTTNNSTGNNTNNNDSNRQVAVQQAWAMIPNGRCRGTTMGNEPHLLSPVLVLFWFSSVRVSDC